MSSIPALQHAINSAVPGDVVVLEKGVFILSENLSVSKKGTKDKPVTIEAESAGNVEFKGISGIIINSESSYIIIKGFKFLNNSGIC